MWLEFVDPLYGTLLRIYRYVKAIHGFQTLSMHQNCLEGFLKHRVLVQGGAENRQSDKFPAAAAAKDQT